MTFSYILYYRPYASPYHQLAYHQSYWLLQNKKGIATRFEQVKVDFDGGIFVWLTLSKVNKTQRIVIFKDQISKSEYRMLRLLECKNKQI